MENKSEPRCPLACTRPSLADHRRRSPTHSVDPSEKLQHTGSFHFLTDLYFWVRSLWCLFFLSPFKWLVVSEVERAPLLLPFLFCLIVLRAGRVSRPTMAFRGPLSTISMFSVFAWFFPIAFRIFSWVFFPGCCSLKRPVFIAGIVFSGFL